MMVKWFLRALCIGSLLVAVGCGKSTDDNPVTSARHAPEITTLSASPVVMHVHGCADLNSTITDAGPDSFRCWWTASWGTVATPTMPNTRWSAVGTVPDLVDTLHVSVTLFATDSVDTTHREIELGVLLYDSTWDTGEPFVDLPDEHGVYNGVFDSIEPWIDRPDSNGINNVGVYDPWDPYLDLNANGHWDAGEVWFDLPTSYRGAGQPRGLAMPNGQYDGPNGEFDDYELFTYRVDPDSALDPHLPVQYTWDVLTVSGQSEIRYDWLTLPQLSGGEPGYYTWVAGKSTWMDFDSDEVFDALHSLPFSSTDLWFDTGEPFIDLPDSNGVFNGHRDPGEIWFDLPSSFAGPLMPRGIPTTNGVYDGPNGYVDEYELFTCPYGLDPHYPVYYTWEDVRGGIHNHGQEWLHLPADNQGHAGYLLYITGKSTWTDRNGNHFFDL
jgi:hypothetical protein